MADAAASPAAPAQTTRPTRPDEALFKKELIQAEKDHKESMDKLVCLTLMFFDERYIAAYTQRRPQTRDSLRIYA